jgi:hypothetical protein
MKEKSLKKSRKKLWDIQSIYVRRKEKGICFTCEVKKNWKEQDAGHFIHKDCLDFDERNIHCQCHGCNRWHHGNLIVFAMKLEKLFGYGIIQELKHLGDQIKIWKVSELEEKITYYKNKIREL